MLATPSTELQQLCSLYNKVQLTPLQQLISNAVCMSKPSEDNALLPWLHAFLEYMGFASLLS